MPRAVNPKHHAAKRDEFIDAGRRLIQTRGYEQLSIDDVLAEVGASKGAFYHYFDGKGALLEAIVDRLVDAALATVVGVVEDERLSAPDKLVAFFRTIANFKAEQIDFLLALINVWFSDDNAVVRERMRRRAIERVTPHFASIIRQGIAEGHFVLADPEPMARVAYALLLDMGDEAAQLFIRRQAGEIDYTTVVRRIDTFQAAFERLLGAQPGSLRLIDEETLRLWFDRQEEDK